MQNEDMMGDKGFNPMNKIFSFIFAINDDRFQAFLLAKFKFFALLF